ncbi:hypothetical protein [Leptolyngbya sp. O-77]|uniref:hypothetical protein n=1 Tax=Leptolyngbya sp. O-77 TaxID=1080068 RepID=UPI00074D434F|nr:hypothetical protein [Leptolyngbya sp. O-77]BAU41846.1 hypothetical protein O77CONTIG1_01659 [Leptolyngbya sp. O-77]
MKRRNLEHHSLDRPTLNPVLLGGMVIAMAGLLVDLRGMVSPVASSGHHEACQGTVNQQVALSREQLAQLLTVPERDSRDRITQIAGAPYCQLQNIQVRAGVAAERQVYPLAFDPQTRLVILYEGNEYAGYRFSFQ